MRPDLSRVKLVDPATYGPQEMNDMAPAAPVKDMEPKPEFGLKFDIDEAERKFGADRFYGTVSNLSVAPLNYLWSVACLPKATPGCIEGTNISELSVMDDVDGKTVMAFENGQWTVDPKGNLACTIRDRLINDYADELPKENIQQEQAERETFMGRKPNPEGPRVMDTMSDSAVGKAMTEAMQRGTWDEVKAALEAPLNPAPDIASGQADAASPASIDDDAAIAARVDEIKAEREAKTNKDPNTKGGGRTR